MKGSLTTKATSSGNRHLLCPHMSEGIYIILPSLMGEEFQGVCGQHSDSIHTKKETGGQAFYFLFFKENSHQS